jgi:Uma2 family endonuclease
MSPTTMPPETSAALRPKAARWRWTRDAFNRLTELGFFHEDDRVELIQGEIVPMSPPSPLHASYVNPVEDILKALFGNGFYVRTEQPLALSVDSQPQPDIAVCVGTGRDYRASFPNADQTRLVVEIANTTLADDRAVKGPLYASADIPEYWIMNLADECLEVYREPDGTQYRWRRIYTLDETVTPVAAPAASVAVSALFDP